MKRAVLSVLVVSLCICFTACKMPTEPTREVPVGIPDATIAVTQEPKPTSTEPEVIQEPSNESQGSLLYLDPEIDMYMTIASADWIYTKELYRGAVYFYPQEKNPMISPTGFAISAQEKWNAPIDDVWETVKPNLISSIPGFEWQREEALDVGDYSGYRYHFWGEGITGDYIIWETQDLLYICSLTAEQEDYQNAIKLLLESLKSFKTLGEVSAD